MTRLSKAHTHTHTHTAPACLCVVLSIIRLPIQGAKKQAGNLDRRARQGRRSVVQPNAWKMWVWVMCGWHACCVLLRVSLVILSERRKSFCGCPLSSSQNEGRVNGHHTIYNCQTQLKQGKLLSPFYFPPCSQLMASLNGQQAEIVHAR